MDSPAVTEPALREEPVQSTGPEADSEQKSSTAEKKAEDVFAQPSLPRPISKSASSSSSGVSPSSSSTPSPDQLAKIQLKKEQLAKEKEAKYQQILSTLSYNPPKYCASKADTRYTLEVLKNGTILENFRFSAFDRKGYYIVGRVPGCDVVAENPTVSRLHAILQFIEVPKEETRKGQDCTDSPQETGLYLYDLKSTHGTFLNKNQLFPYKFYRVHVGHVLKFGTSQRMYIVNGPGDDEEEESEKSVTELQNERLKKELEKKRLEDSSQNSASRDNVEEDGITWGMAEDAEEESDLKINPFAMDYEACELSLDNPKKSLRSWFEREGHDLEFEIREKSAGQYICRIALPLDGPTDGNVYAESEVKGKKKEAAHDAAMKACQILDSHGLLRTSNQESRKRKEKKWEDEDYYSSDEDTFLDRTGSIEKKRQKRMQLAGKTDQDGGDNVVTYDSLCAKYSEYEKEMAELKDKVSKSEQMKQRADDGDIDIDDYMKLLNSGVFDVKKLKSRVKVVQEEMEKTKKLMEIAKPAELPSYLQTKSHSTGSTATNEPAKATTERVTVSTNDVQMEDTLQTSTVPISQPKATFKTPVIGPMKPPTKATPPQVKRYGLITPENFAVLKEGPARPPDSTTSQNSQEDDAPFEEEEDSSSEEEQEVSSSAKEVDQPDEDPSGIPEFTKSTKKKRQRYRNQQKGKGKQGSVSSGQAFDDPSYSEWVPPIGQSGDGKTSLNAKLGY